MFDIGGLELILIAVVALLVIGPERLPETLRTMGLWLGRLRRSFMSVKSEIEKEIGMDEVRRQLHNEAVMDEMKRIEQEVKAGLNDTSAATAATIKSAEAATEDAAKALQKDSAQGSNQTIHGGHVEKNPQPDITTDAAESNGGNADGSVSAPDTEALEPVTSSEAEAALTAELDSPREHAAQDGVETEPSSDRTNDKSATKPG